MILPDTSVWIEYLRRRDTNIYSRVRSHLENENLMGLSVVFGELTQGIKNRRERMLISYLWDGLPKINEANLFIRAGILSNTCNLHSKGVGLIDCYILAAAMAHDLSLWSLDKKLTKAAKEVGSIKLI